MGLENYEAISNEEALVKDLNEAIEWFTKEENTVAKEAIKGLNEKNLTTFIEKSFKNNNSERLTYSEMKQNSFYGFMVQSAIDLLSNKLASDGGKENKYDKNWKIDENGKTLDNWIRDSGWIDNVYWWWTRNIVKMVQHILGIHEDWFAWPQFFAKVCSILKWESISNFSVKWYEKWQDYPYWFWEKIKNNNYELPEWFELKSFKEGTNWVQYANIYNGWTYSNYYLMIKNDWSAGIMPWKNCNEDVDGKITINNNKIEFIPWWFCNYKAGSNEWDLNVIIKNGYELYGIEPTENGSDTYVYRIKKDGKYCWYITKKSGENPKFDKWTSEWGIKLLEKYVFIGGNSVKNKKKLRYLE